MLLYNIYREIPRVESQSSITQRDDVVSDRRIWLTPLFARARISAIGGVPTSRAPSDWALVWRRDVGEGSSANVPPRFYDEGGDNRSTIRIPFSREYTAFNRRSRPLVQMPEEIAAITADTLLLCAAQCRQIFPLSRRAGATTPAPATATVIFQILNWLPAAAAREAQALDFISCDFQSSASLPEYGHAADYVPGEESIIFQPRYFTLPAPQERARPPSKVGHLFSAPGCRQMLGHASIITRPHHIAGDALLSY